MGRFDDLLDEGLTHHRAGRWQQAESLYLRVLASDPEHGDANHLLGLIHHQAGRHEQAVELIERSIRQGAHAVRYNNLGEAYRAWRKLPQALSAYQQALRLQPDFAEAHNNLGTVYQNLDQPEQALSCYDRAIELSPHYANARYNRARLWLSLGRFVEGWREYEWRWAREEFARPPLPVPIWDGSPLAGRTLLVEAEQGLGDTLQFIRLVEQIDSPREKVFLKVQPALLPLLAQSGFSNLIPQGAPVQLPHDLHISLMSLPAVLGTTLESLPGRVPYLSANPALVAKWRQRLEQPGLLNVGIHWQGYQFSPLEPGRSFPLAEFEPVAKLPGVRLISLQKGFGSEQIARVVDRFNVVDLGDKLDREQLFLDTAAIIQGLDLVVTSDSAVAHLAGALGKTVWVVLPLAADWRWMRARVDSPWYPTMRLFRQQTLGDWSQPMDEVAAALQPLARGKANGRRESRSDS